jgi:hypothetical protein
MLRIDNKFLKGVLLLQNLNTFLNISNRLFSFNELYVNSKQICDHFLEQFIFNFLQICYKFLFNIFIISC